jgi:hypothetical protein
MRTGRDAVKVADAYVAAIAEIGTDFDYIHGAAYKGIPLSALVAARLTEIHQIDKRRGYDRKEKKAHGVPLLELIIVDLRAILKITEIFDLLLNKGIEGGVYVDVKVKKDFEGYFGKYERKC